MSAARRLCFVLIAIITIASIFFMASCTGTPPGPASSNTSGGNESKETDAVSEVKGGKLYETQKFFILWPDLWDVVDVPDGVQVYTASNTVLMTVSASTATEAEVKTQVEDMAKQNSGTPLEEVTMFGVKLFRTSFTSDDKDQTIYSGITNGEQVTIKIVGKDNQNNETIKAMLESIKLK